MPQLGILHIRTEGLARFEVREHAVDASGLVIGRTTPVADEPQQPLPAHQAPLAQLLEQIAARLPAEHFPAPARYDDASWVGYRLAELLPLPLSIRQRMLEVSDASVRLAALRQFMERQGLV
jgi:Lon protease-like protein